MRFFLSSTYEDLKGFRQVAINTLEDLCCEVEAMEYFEASTKTNREVCLSKLIESDLVIGIYGRRYGTIDKVSGKSFTELEYDTAVENNIPVISFVLECPEYERENREKELVKKIMGSGILCAKINKKKDFIIKLNNSLIKYFQQLEGRNYTGIWSDIISAERKMGAYFDSIDDAIKELELFATDENFDETKKYRFNAIVAFLRVNRLKDRLLHETWSDSLREEVVLVKKKYIKTISDMELLDIVDENGNPTGAVMDRKTIHEMGYLHRTSHLWLLRKHEGNIQVLVQKRAMEKDSHPGCYDISSAGHIPAGSDFKESAIRELEEELGVKADEEDLIFCGTRHIKYEEVFHHKKFKDNQVSNVYAIWLDTEEPQFILQKSEIESVMWMDYKDCRNKVQKKDKGFPNCIRMEELEMLKKTINIV